MKLPSGPAAVDTARALVALGQTTVLFHLCGRRAVARAARRSMASPARHTPSGMARGDELRRAWSAVRRARRLWPVRVMCLQHALVTRRVLEARGIVAVVRIGVRREADRLHAHAWVEADGYVLDDSAAHAAFVALGLPAGDNRSVLAGSV